MTRRTRYFMAGSAAVMAAGLCAGLIAYYGGGFQALSASTGPTELAYVPADATVIAYADVRSIMDSELRQQLKQVMPVEPQGQQEFRELTGIDIERDIQFVVAAMTPDATLRVSGLLVARGVFDVVRLEALARDHGAEVQDYKGKRLLVLNNLAHGGDGRHGGVLAFLEPGLVGVGELSAVQRAIDAQMSGQSVTSNDEMMTLVSEIERYNNAWTVGRFDVLAGQANLPDEVAQHIPAVKWFAAAGHINGGIAGTLRAEANDDQSAENLRAVVNGFVALAKLQAQNDPRLGVLAQSVVVGGTGRTITLSFTVPTELLQLVTPKVQVQ